MHSCNSITSFIRPLNSSTELIFLTAIVLFYLQFGCRALTFQDDKSNFYDREGKNVWVARLPENNSYSFQWTADLDSSLRHLIGQLLENMMTRIFKWLFSGVMLHNIPVSDVQKKYLSWTRFFEISAAISLSWPRENTKFSGKYDAEQ